MPLGSAVKFEMLPRPTPMAHLPARRESTVRSALVAGLLFAIAQTARAQVLLQWTLFLSPEPQSGALFGSGLRACDFNKDGFDDLLALEPLASIGTATNCGRAWILFGPDFKTAAELHASPPVLQERLGHSSQQGLSTCALGDFNGDREIDVLVGSPDFGADGVDLVGRAHLFLGPDFSSDVVIKNPRPEAKARFGESVLLADRNGDGHDDVIVSASGATAPGSPSQAEAGAVYVWTSPDLVHATKLTNAQPVFQSAFGSSLDKADVNGDSIPDLLVGANNFQIASPFVWGALDLYDGQSLGLMQTILSPSPDGLGGFGDVVYAGDLTGDGIQDLLVSAWEAPLVGPGGCGLAGSVVILAGPGFSSVAHVFHSPVACSPSGLGFWFGLHTIVADMNKDGSQDVIIGDPTKSLGEARAYIFFGPDYGTIQVLGDDFAPFLAQAFGADFAAGDFDGDGRLELAVHAPLANGIGSIYLYDVQTLVPNRESLSLSQGGEVELAFKAGADEVGNQYAGFLSLSGSDPGVIPQPGLFVPLNVDSITAAGLALLNTSVLPGFAGVLDQTGKATLEIHVAPGMFAPLAGQTLTVVALTIEPSGHLGTASNAAQVALLP